MHGSTNLHGSRSLCLRAPGRHDLLQDAAARRWRRNLLQDAATPRWSRNLLQDAAAVRWSTAGPRAIHRNRFQDAAAERRSRSILQDAAAVRWTILQDIGTGRRRRIQQNRPEQLDAPTLSLEPGQAYWRGPYLTVGACNGTDRHKINITGKSHGNGDGTPDKQNGM